MLECTYDSSLGIGRHNSTTDMFSFGAKLHFVLFWLDFFLLLLLVGLRHSSRNVWNGITAFPR